MILLLVELLLFAGGWLRFERKRDGIKLTAACIALFASLFIPTASIGRVRFYPAAGIAVLLLLLLDRREHTLRGLLLGVVCGLAEWKLIDWFPLFRPLPLLMILPGLLVCYTVPMDDGTKRLLLAIAPYIISICTMLMDQFLFRYSVLSLGTENGFCATMLGVIGLQTASILRESWQLLRQALHGRQAILKNKI